jgi:DNA invertase Pin-like site-specific DNA recombinase
MTKPKKKPVVTTVYSNLPSIKRYQADKPPGFENYLTVKELAKFLNVSRETVKWWLNKGYLTEDLRTNHDWKLFSPDKCTEILQKRSQGIKFWCKIK